MDVFASAAEQFFVLSSCPSNWIIFGCIIEKNTSRIPIQLSSGWSSDETKKATAAGHLVAHTDGQMLPQYGP